MRMRTDWAAAVLAAVDEELSGAYALLSSLVRTPSLTGSDAEHDLSGDLARRLDGLGLEVDHWQVPLDEILADPAFPGTEAPRSEAWGLVGRLPGTGDGPSLMLNGHVDVVPPGDLASWRDPDPFTGAYVGGDIVGRGACDMKGGLVAALAAVRALRRAQVPLRGDLLLACVQSEEDGGLGTFATLRRGWTADACVLPEPTSLDLVPANGGALTFRLRVPGRATHASRRTVGVSAIDKLFPLMAALEALERRRNGDVDPLMRRWPIAYPISLGTVHAGDWASTVPDLLIAEGRLGVALGEPVEQARTALEEAIAEACAGDPWLREHPATVEWWGGQFASGRCPAESDLTGRLRQAHARVGGGAQEEWGAPYGSDLRLLVAAGVPTVHYGPGDAALAHAPDERVPLDEVATCARALTLLALDVCGTS
jgi:acetylornithine deacetylase